ncbi:ABC transporter ATP-binding protein [Pokkaliibacter sp. MBI-7]|uniref:metal ABC transporter ATP-binding protein n=1 Tax=Pokkaliibacter sp. MBI-7 TaxID=3040600 RepID=UPI002448BEAF|nr:ABC transporter ATP-binding protein [Pokkaliibacter sp. MBI-7]MDH2431803.1 ABC transporter ATP-binding protein [Pokkaliibacter sp. MBI-7]
MSALVLDDITVAYQRHPAVHHISGEFASGSLTAIAGPNGAGKSTLLKAIMGEVPLASGRIHYGLHQQRDIGYLPQAAAIDRQFPLTVADTVIMGAWRTLGVHRAVTQDVAEQARNALQAVGLAGFEQRPIGSLSAGQFQRVLFARLLLQDAPIVVLDEPFTAIDSRTTHDLLQVILGWHRQGRTVIAVLHDFEQVRQHFPSTLLLAREAIGWGDTSAVMSRDNLTRAKAMAEAWDEGANVCQPEVSA